MVTCISQKSLQDTESFEPYVLKCIYGGYQFEECVSVGLEAASEDEIRTTLERKEFCCVYRTRMGPHSIVYAAEIDCFEQKLDMAVFQQRTPARQVNAIEIKTSAEIHNDIHLNRFKKKIVRWWAQAQLVDCSYVVCGFRNKNMVVNKVVAYTMDDLVRQGAIYWKPSVCRAFLFEFLNFVKKEVSAVKQSKKDNFCVGFAYDPVNQTVNVIDCPDDRSVLPHWFNKQFKNADD